MTLTRTSFGPNADIALIGEIETRRELAAEGWFAVNANTEKGNFPNVDLIAAKGNQARALQVKTTNAEKGSHKDNLFMGRAEGWLTHQVPFFNAKDGPLMATVVVLVHAKRTGSRFVVLPVALAEKLARFAAELWYSVPKIDGGKRAPGFDARLPFVGLRKSPLPADAFLQSTLMEFEDRWEILDSEVATLLNENAWGVTFPAA